MIAFFSKQNSETVVELVYNKLIVFRADLQNIKTGVFFKEKVERVIESVGATNVSLANWIEKFHESFKNVSDKFEKRFELQKTVIEFFKSVRIFNPKQRNTLSGDNR